jgi:hypothetical protein
MSEGFFLCGYDFDSCDILPDLPDDCAHKIYRYYQMDALNILQADGLVVLRISVPRIMHALNPSLLRFELQQ